MSNCDSFSNCSESNSSDEIRSLSSLSSSCISEFNTEYNELRHLLNPRLYPKPENRSLTPKNEITDNEKELQNLRCELSNALKLNEKYKLELYNLKSSIELEYSEKITILLQKNNHLEDEISSANEQIKRLLKHLKNGGNSKVSDLEEQQHLLIAERRKYKEKSQELKKVNNELINENQQLKIKINEQQIDIQAKINAVNQLKEKISEQHIENEQLLKNNSILKHTIEDAKRESSDSKKSEFFYRDQLKNTKNERNELKRTVNNLKIIIDEKDNLICDLKSEIAKWGHKYDLLLLKNFEEQKNLQKLAVDNECLQGTINENNLPSKDSLNKSEEIINYVENVYHYEHTIEDLVCQLKCIKQNVEDLQMQYDKLLKENVLIKKHNVELLNTKFEINQLKETNMEINNRYELCTKHLKQKTDEVQDLQQQIIQLEINLNSKIKENDLILSSIANLREKFGKFKLSHIKLKADLDEKNKVIQNMEEDLKRLNVLQEKFSKNEALTNDLKIRLDKKEQEYVKLLELQEKNRNKSSLEVSKLLSNLDEKDAAITALREEMHLIVMEKNKSIEELNEIITHNNKAIQSYVQQLKKLQDKQKEKEKVQNVITKRKMNSNKSSQKAVENFLNSINNIQTDMITLSVIKNAVVGIEKFAKCLEDSELYCENDFQTFINIQLIFVKLLEKFCIIFNKISTINNENKYDNENQMIEEIKRLRTLLRVEQLDKIEKRKKYEANYRTLLRTVKDHMKSHNSAKKENAYLQTLYNNLANENNELKLKTTVYQTEIDNLHKSLYSYKENNDKLSTKVRELQRKQSSIETESFENIKVLEQTVDELKIKLVNLESQFNQLEQLNVELEKKFSELNIKNVSLSEENVKLLKEKNNKDLELKKFSENVENLREKLKLELDKEIKLENDKYELQSTLKQIKDQNDLFSNEIDTLRVDKQEFQKQLEEFEKSKQHLVDKTIENEKCLNETIINLKSLIERQNLANNSLSNEKYFLQRLCNDLKMSLKVHVNHNKVLKEQVDLLRQRSDCDSSISSNSLNDINIPAAKYDEDYINQLLHANKATVQDKPLLEIQGGLNNLKLEIMILQNQIAKKYIKN